MVRNGGYDKFLLCTGDMVHNSLVAHMMPEIENSWKYKFRSWLKVLATWQFKKSPGERFFIKVFKKQDREARLVVSKEGNKTFYLLSNWNISLNFMSFSR